MNDVALGLVKTTVISSVGILTIILLKKNLLQKYSKNFNYYIWLFLLIRMFLIFSIPINIDSYVFKEQNNNSFINYYSNTQSDDINNKTKEDFSEQIENDTVLGSNNSVKNEEIKKTLKQYNVVEKINYFKSKAEKFKYKVLIVYIWLSIATVIAIYKLYEYYKFKSTLLDLSYYKKKNNEYQNNVYCVFENLLEEMKVNKIINLKFSEDTVIPMGIGIRNKYIILPNIEYEYEDVKWILKHEIMHYKKNDLLYKFMVSFITIIYWFNPLVYLMRRSIEMDCELACDESTLIDCTFNERKKYALTLIKSLKVSNNNLACVKLSTMFGSKESLKRRFDSMFNRKTKRGIIIGVVLAAICTTTIFTINSKDVSGNEIAAAATEKSSSNNEIELYEINNDKFKGYYMEIRDPKRIKIGLATDTDSFAESGEDVQTVSEIVEKNGAIAGVNGGAFMFVNESLNFFEDEEELYSPSGIVMSQGKIMYNDLDESEKESLFAITEDGKLICGEYSVNELKEMNAKEALSFSPLLISNGKMTKKNLDWGIAPRTAIGQKEDGTIILLVIDGRSLESLGATIQETQEILYKLGAVNAINLDGGKSSTMYYNGRTINESEGRKIPTSVIVK